MGTYWKIAKLPREVKISYAFAYVFAASAASAANTLANAYEILTSLGNFAMSQYFPAPRLESLGEQILETNTN